MTTETIPNTQTASSSSAARRSSVWFGLSDRMAIAVVLLGMTLLRLAIAQFGRYFEDWQVLIFRAQRLAQLPMNQLYLTNQGTVDHLPGDLWFLWYISNAYRALAPNGDFYGDTFLYLTKLIPIAADAGVAVAIYLIARDLAGPRAGLIGALLYALSPGPIVVASLWDQWDAISTCAALFAIWLFLRHRYELAAATLTYAALVKPQFAMFGLLFAVAFVYWNLFPGRRARKDGERTILPARLVVVSLARAGAALLTAWVTAEAILVPFNVSIPPLSAQFDLRDRLRYVSRVHDQTTLNAFNFWATPIAGNAVHDSQVSFLGMTSRTWGQILFAGALLLIVALWWRRGTDKALVWACLAMSFSSFMLPTRIHERYLLPAVALAALVAAVQPRLIWFSIALGASYAVNVIAVYVMAHDKTGAPFFNRYDPGMMLVAIINVGLLAWLLDRGLPATEATTAAHSRSVAGRRGRFARVRR